MTSVLSSPSSSHRRSAEPPAAESREETLRRQLAARRRAKEQAQVRLPSPEAARVADVRSSSGNGISIKGKGREMPQPERTGGMRGWEEARDETPEMITRRSPSRAGSEGSSLAYPRSPSPRRSRSPRGRYRYSRSPSPDEATDDGGRHHDRSPEPRRRDWPSNAHSPRSPPRAGRDDHSLPQRPPRPPHRRSAEPVSRDRSPHPPPPRRTFDNPDRLAMRQDNRPPPPVNQRYDPRRNIGGPIQAEPMRGPDEGRGERRPSPSYNAYERPPHLAGNGPGGPGSGGNGYGYGPGRRDLGNAPPLGQGGGWQNPPRRQNGPVDFEQRRLQRENSTLIVWPDSPKEPYRDDDEIEADRRAARKASKAKSKKTKHRSRYSSASSSESSGEEERRSRRKREKRRRYASSDSDSDVEVDKRRKRHQSSGSDSEEERTRRKRKSKSKSKSRAKSSALDDDEWLEKRARGAVSETPLSLEDLARIQKKKKEEEEEIGPIMPHDTVRLQQRQRYEDMRPGEGEAMELYASNGMRIPRRGEIGIDTKRIETLEGSGYVMSGARNKKMNAMRLRKENQVISAEEKRAILNLQREEKIKKEGMIVSQFRELMNTSLQRQG